MLENLSNRLQGIFSGLRSKGRLTEEDINAAMREIRMALLEADVNFKVVKAFVARTKERCLEADVLDSLTPAQNVIKIVLDELTELLGRSDAKLELGNRIPAVIMLVGLQGSGKTTAAAKLAYRLKQQNHSPLLVAADVYRPAAADQLQTLGGEIGVKVYRHDGADPVDIAREGVQEAIDSLRDVVIIDTAGRLHVDEAMMEEARAIKEALQPEEILMVVDAMTGQDVVNVVSAFAEAVDFDGVIMSKMDGDARGGGALSVREVTGKPIKFISSGEKPDSLEEFHPDRMAKRILGMGDMVSLIENAVRLQQEQEEAEEAEAMAAGNLTLDDFITMNRQIRKMGGISKFISALPGGDKALIADAVGTIFGALMGTSTVTTFVESSTGIQEGGRTGLASVVTGLLFLLAILLAPVAGIIPGAATAPALIIVGVYMIHNAVQVNWSDFEEALPCFLTIAMMPFAYSISDGIGFGFISYAVIKVARGKYKEVPVLIYLLSALFILMYALP